MTEAPTGWRVTPAADFRPGAPDPERQSLWVSVVWAREQAAYARSREEYHRLRQRKFDRPYRWLAFINPIVVAVTGTCLVLSKGEGWGVVVALIAFGASAAEASYRSLLPWLQQRGQSHLDLQWTWHLVHEDLNRYCDRDARDPMLTYPALQQHVASLELSLRNAIDQERRQSAAVAIPAAAAAGRDSDA